MSKGVQNERLLEAIRVEAMFELSQAAGMIRHCLDQLDPKQVWWRPDESTNSIGNLLLHICGNVRQWIVIGLTGQEDHRRRQEEFDQRDPIAPEVLWQLVNSTLDEARTSLAEASAETLLGERAIQGFDVNGLRAVFHSVSHFRGHVQEIVHLTRRQLGPKYRFEFVPQSAAQGAP